MSGEEVLGLEVLPGGGVLVAVSPQLEDNAAFVMRLSRRGRLDRAFGTDGIVTVDTRLTMDTGGEALVALPDGGFAVAGFTYTYPGGFPPAMAAAKYDRDGHPERGFGAEGVQTIRFTAQTTRATSLTVGEDGSLFVAGTADAGFSSGQATRSFALAKLLANGEPDLSFGGGEGQVTTAPLVAGDSEAVAKAVFHLADGRILLAGVQNQGFHGGCPRFVTARLLPDGAADPSYADAGIAVRPEAPPCPEFAGAALGPAGDLFMAGVNWDYFDADPPFSVTQLDSSGAPVAAFAGGNVVMRFRADHPHDVAGVAVTPAGLPLVAGSLGFFGCPGSAGVCEAFALVRLRMDGTLDPSFAGDGLLIGPSCRRRGCAPPG